MLAHVETLSLHDPVCYRISVQGILDKTWAAELDLSLTYPDNVAENPVTILSGRLADQAALLGLLTRLYGLGLPLLSVERLPDNCHTVTG